MRKKFFKKCLASTMALALVITGTNSIPALAAKKASVSLKKTSVSVTVGKNVKLSVVKKNVKKEHNNMSYLSNKLPLKVFFRFL